MYLVGWTDVLCCTSEEEPERVCCMIQYEHFASKVFESSNI